MKKLHPILFAYYLLTVVLILLVSQEDAKLEFILAKECEQLALSAGRSKFLSYFGEYYKFDE